MEDERDMDRDRDGNYWCPECYAARYAEPIGAEEQPDGILQKIDRAKRQVSP